MKIKEYVELHRIAGELEGTALVLDWTEEVDLKKLKESLKKISADVKAIAEQEREKLEDVDLKDEKKDSKKVADPKKEGAKP